MTGERKEESTEATVPNKRIVTATEARKAMESLEWLPPRTVRETAVFREMADTVRGFIEQSVEEQEKKTSGKTVAKDTPEE